MTSIYLFLPEWRCQKNNKKPQQNGGRSRGIWGRNSFLFSVMSCCNCSPTIKLTFSKFRTSFALLFFFKSCPLWVLRSCHTKQAFAVTCSRVKIKYITHAVRQFLPNSTGNELAIEMAWQRRSVIGLFTELSHVHVTRGDRMNVRHFVAATYRMNSNWFEGDLPRERVAVTSGLVWQDLLSRHLHVSCTVPLQLLYHRGWFRAVEAAKSGLHASLLVRHPETKVCHDFLARLAVIS